MKLGDYELLREHGGIGAGTVWVARAQSDTSESPKLFSVVRVHKHLVKKPDVAEAFTNDAKPAVGFRHANVAALISAGDTGGELAAISEHHEGELLSGLVTAAGTEGLPLPVVVRITLDVLEALTAAHEHEPPIFHGELGPHQVLVGADGVARVLGLGTSRALSRVAPPLGVKNQDRLAYAAPERVKALASPLASAAASAPLDARTDLFSVGVMLWEGLTKQRLFASKIDAAIVQKVLTAAIAAPSTTGAPSALDAPTQKLLERDPAKRTRSAAMAIAELEGLEPDQIATAAQVAETVEKLAGKAIASRRSELAKPASSKPAASVPAAPVKVGDPGARKATLLGIPAPAKPAAAKPEPAPPAGSKSASPSKPEPKPPTPKPAAAKEAAPEAPKPAAESPKPAVAAPKAEPPVATPKPAPAAAKPATSGQPVESASKPSHTPAAAKPAMSGQLLESQSKPSHTPGSDDRSPVSRGRGMGTEKVGPGSTLGRYEILTPVARGGMASVWAARLPGSRGFQKIFAIKTMLPDVSDDPDFENMFLDEGRIAARIRHPNVVEIIDLGEQDEVLYLVMEWVDGENLGALVKAARQIGGVPLPVVLKIASQIASGLHAAHELRDDDGNLVDLVHRDVSPANVLVSTSGYVKIVDFGIAKSKGRLHQTRVGGVVKGKTPYLSPEQLGQLPIDRRSDIFSFGVLLYVLTTGLHPFRGETDAKTIENIALREPVPLKQIVPSTPTEFEALVLKALAKDAKDRFATAAEMHRAIEQAAAANGLMTTEEDVAAFVKQALGDQVGKRAQELKAAIDRADGRVPSTTDEEPSHDGAASGPKPRAPSEPDSVDPLAATAMQPEGGPPPVPIKTAAITMPDIEPDPEPSGPVAAVAAKPAAEEEVSFDEPKAPTPHFAVPPPPPEPEAPVAAPPPIAAPPPVAATRAASPSDAEGPLEVPGAPKKRKPVALIAVAAVLGVCGIIGAVALFGGSKGSDTRPAATGTPRATTAATAAAPVRTGTPAPAPAPAPAPTPTAAETAAPADTGSSAAAMPVDTVTPTKQPPNKGGPVKQQPGGRPPPSKKNPPSGKFNPTGI